jgi:hypothetical protein
MNSQMTFVGRALGVMAGAVLATGCTVANPFSPANASAKSNADQMALKWAQCMRQHGVNVPDPENGRITVQSTPGAGGQSQFDPNSQQFQDAQNACQKYAPNGGTNSGPPSQQMIDQATKYSQCMREHGITGFPDPQVQGNGLRVDATPGAFDPNSDQFKQAQKACEHFKPGAGTGKSNG